MDEYGRPKRSLLSWGRELTELGALPDEDRAWSSFAAGQILPRRRSFFDPDGFRALGTSAGGLMNAAAPRREALLRPLASPAPVSKMRPGDRVYNKDGSYYTRTENGGLEMPLFDEMRNPDGSVHLRNRVDGSVSGPVDNRVRLPNGYHNMLDDNGGVTVLLGPPAPKAPPPKTAPLPYDVKLGARIGNELKPYLRDTGIAYTAATGRRLVATDGFRTPEEQAVQMFKKFRGGEASLYRNRNALKPILQVYTEGRRVGLRDDEVRAGMTKVIQKQIDNQIFVSPHLNDHGLDIRIRKLSRSDLAELRKAVAKAKGRLTIERDHYHVQFPRKSDAGVPSRKPGT